MTTAIILMAVAAIIWLLSSLLLLAVIVADCIRQRRHWRDRKARNAGLRNVEAFRDIQRLHVHRADGDEILRVVNRDAA